MRFALANIDDAPPDPLRHESFRFEQVKLDRHIMMLDEEECRQRLNALVRAVRPSGATVVAEGVESIKHHEAASQSGVDLGQGFLCTNDAP